MGHYLSCRSNVHPCCANRLRWAAGGRLQQARSSNSRMIANTSFPCLRPAGLLKAATCAESQLRHRRHPDGRHKAKVTKCAGRASGEAEEPMREREHLAQADRFIAECTKRIVHQRDVIASAFQKGHATDVPVSMLRALEASLRAFEGHRLLIVDRQKDAERR